MTAHVIPLHRTASHPRGPAQVIAIDRAAPTHLILRNAFLDLADRAERGEINGMVNTVFDRAGNLRYGVLGAAQANPAKAHYGAARLADMLLWPEDLDSN